MRTITRSQACILATFLWTFPAATFASVSADSQVTSGSVTLNYQSASPAANVLSLGGTEGTLQFSSTPNCVGLACGINGPAVGAYLASGGQGDGVDSTIRYTFDVVGAAGAVPVLVFGQYAVIDPFELPARSGGTSATGVVDIHGSLGQRLFNFQSLCYNYDPANNEQAPAANCGSGSFQGSFLASSGTAVSVYMDASARRYLNDRGLPAASAYIDPFFEIDPVWAAAHPGYSLAFDPGVGNGMPNAIGTAPVPEPESIVLMAGGLLALVLSRRRRTPARCH